MPFNSLDISPFARLAAGGLLNSLLAGTCLAALAWLVSRLAGRSSSGTRFAVWFVALIGIALLPWVGSVAAASSVTQPTRVASVITLPESLAFYLLISWIIGTSLGLIHISHGLYRLQRLRASCTPVHPEQLNPMLRESLARMLRQRGVTLCISNAVRVPAAIGYFRPMVVLPAWSLAEIPPQELNAILVHELAHLRRFDDWTNLAQKLIRALFFFHPAVWFIDSRLTLEREMACDDAVLAANFAPRAYAESLVTLAEKSFLRRGIQLAQAAVGHVQQLKVRLSAILRKDRNLQISLRIGRPAIALISLAAVVSAYGAVRSPHWIAFSDGPNDQIAQSVAPPGLSASNIRLKPVNIAFSGDSSRQISTFPSPPKSARHTTNTKRFESQPVPTVLQSAAINLRIDDEALLPPVSVATSSPHLTDYQVLVIFRGEAFGPDGPVLWRVTVLRLTSAQSAALNGSIRKQI